MQQNILLKMAIAVIAENNSIISLEMIFLYYGNGVRAFLLGLESR